VIQADASSITLGFGKTSATILCDALTHVSSHPNDFFVFAREALFSERPVVIDSNDRSAPPTFVPNTKASSFAISIAVLCGANKKTEIFTTKIYA